MDRGGMIRGPGSGVQDLVHGSIDNRQKVLLSDGEFVVPARVFHARSIVTYRIEWSTLNVQCGRNQDLADTRIGVVNEVG